MPFFSYLPTHQVEYEAARTELLEEVARGVSVEDLRFKLTKKKGEEKLEEPIPPKSRSNLSVKQSLKKKYPKTERIQRKKRDVLQILHKHNSPSVKDKISFTPKALTAVQLYVKEKEEQGDGTLLSKKVFKLGDKEILVCLM